MALELRDIVVKDGSRTLVSQACLTLEPGQVTAVLGSNGAGKSELVLAMAGMLPIAFGTMIVDGVAMTGRGPDVIRAAGVAAVPEGHRVLTKLSVDENLRAADAILPEGLRETLTDVYQLFPELAERKSQIAGTLSGGQQQMVALGHALMCRPRYMLIDEMSLGLAPLVVKRLMGVVNSLKARGVGVLLIEQFTDLALGVSEQAMVLRGGQTSYSGSAAALQTDPVLLETAYFGADHVQTDPNRTTMENCASMRGN
ncbi:ABC transporter ATP-binding protein [Parasedimentitalea maritima]|uniref:ATP-binding cassette domain-containing protein n=1 Tax=Parasedimentitalea maritima TaxID=2578117 RepID=A0A6A4RK97_9RHOB|nr:ATP-binding cassette domain-containing protein [Zongyanglinia marina]KAE9630094.1 ATP-binding cassette domain-containing protein [Zongyanglinia marina]